MVFVVLEIYTNVKTHTSTAVSKVFRDRENAIDQIEEFLIEMEETRKDSDEESGLESDTESDESELEPTDPEDSESEPIEHDEQCARIRKLANSIWEGDDCEIFGDVCNPEENFYLEIESEHAFYCVSLEKKKIE
jgi:hypothetical protein